MSAKYPQSLRRASSTGQFSFRSAEPIATRREQTAKPAEEFPLPTELLYDIGIVLAVMLGLALLTNLSFGA
jgi:hypothetical protein